MKPSIRTWSHSHWLFAGCVAIYLGLIGPSLISAASTLAVACGVALFIALIAWAFVLFGKTDNKRN